MDRNNSLMLIDSDIRRRAAVCHDLSVSGIHVEPFEDTGEMMQRWPRNGTILAEDADDNIHSLIEHMTEAGCWLPVIAFCEQPTTARVVHAIMDGAVDYLEWPAKADAIAATLADVDNNAAKIGCLRLREARARSRVQKLTRREREVLTLMASGLGNRLIGEQLSISPRTVEIHRASMLAKLGARHTSEGIRVAIEAGLAS